MAKNEENTGVQHAIVPADKRHPDETEKAHRARVAYCKLAPSQRTIATAYRVFEGMEPDAEVKVPGCFGAWAKRFYWTDRIEIMTAGNGYRYRVREATHPASRDRHNRRVIHTDSWRLVVNVVKEMGSGLAGFRVWDVRGIHIPLNHYVEKINRAGLKDVPREVAQAFDDYGQVSPELAFDGKTRATAMSQMGLGTIEARPVATVHKLKFRKGLGNDGLG